MCRHSKITLSKYRLLLEIFIRHPTNALYCPLGLNQREKENWDGKIKPAWPGFYPLINRRTRYQKKKGKKGVNIEKDGSNGSDLERNLRGCNV
jgi:hypothetical protein